MYAIIFEAIVSVGIVERVSANSGQQEGLVLFRHATALEKLAQGNLRLRASGSPEVSSRDGCILVFAEVSEHLGHVSVNSSSDKELLHHLRDREHWSLKASFGVSSLNIARLFDHVEKLNDADFLGAAQGVLSSDVLVHALSDGAGQVIVVDRLELGVL